MARTPLFRYVRRSFSLAKASLRSGEPADEIVERWAARPRVSGLELSRRELLATSALAAAGLALGCRSGRGTLAAQGLREVAIFGAGIAGLTAAYRLLERQVPVRVFEAQNRVGGRMYSLRGAFAHGHSVELGGELIDTGHSQIRKLAGELGFTLDDFDKDDPALSRELWFFGGRRYSDAEVVAAFRPVAARVQEALDGLAGDWVSHAEPNGGEALDRRTVAEWLDGVEMEPWFRSLLEVAYTTEFGLETSEQSALNFVLMIDPEPDPFHIFGDSDERFHVRGGNDQLPTALAEKLGERVERGVLLEAVTRAADGSYRCSVRRGEASETVAADHVVLAIPFTLLREVRLDLELPAVQRRAIDELGYGTNAKLMVGFSSRLWRTAGGSNGSLMTDLPLQTTWEATRLLPGEGGILVNFTGGRHGLELGQGSPTAQALAFARDLDQVFPGLAALRTGEVRFHWPTHPFTRGSYACYKPGQYTAFGGEEGTAVDGLHFAGEHTSSEAQGFMEGGCESGERAAEEVLEALGIGRRRRARAA